VPAVGDLSHVERQMLRNLLHFGRATSATSPCRAVTSSAVPVTIGFPE
jgi:hypothetical protein